MKRKTYYLVAYNSGEDGTINLGRDFERKSKAIAFAIKNAEGSKWLILKITFLRCGMRKKLGKQICKKVKRVEYSLTKKRLLGNKFGNKKGEIKTF